MLFLLARNLWKFGFLVVLGLATSWVPFLQPLPPAMDEAIPKKSSADGTIALAILVATLLLVVVGGYYFLKSQDMFGSSSSNSQTFAAPAEREAYLKGREKLDIRNPAEFEELKKLLMRRAIYTIPILLSLQNEGNSIERLYKRGMLTDNMHFHVKELKAFVDKEFQDVQFEADELVEGWGQQIWPQAMQFHQMILKQQEDRTEEQKQSEEDKKKAKKDKEKEKERAKRALKDEAPKESPKEAPKEEPVRVEEDPEVVKLREAERMAQLLLDEEERERNMKKTGSASKPALKK